MAVQPILAPSDTWFTQGGTSIKRASITEIEIKDSYTPTGTPTASWDASAAKDGSVMVYVEGTKLTIAGNGSGKVYANPDSSYVFSDKGQKDYYFTLATIAGGSLLDTSSATTMRGMFSRCNMLVTVDVGNWDTSNVENMFIMFQNCFSITNLDVSAWNVSKVTDMMGMFNMTMSYGACNDLTTLNVSNWDVSKVTTMYSMFNGCLGLTSLEGIEKWNTSSCTNMRAMFYGCQSIVMLNLSNFDVSKVTNMSAMFSSCTSLTSIGDTTNWNTSSCTDMSSMFDKCYSLRELNVSNWNVSKVTTFKSMFSGSSYGEQHMQVTELDVSKWNTSSATDMGWMFYGNPQLKTLDVSNWDVSKVTSFHHMFAWSPGQVLDDKVTNWDVSSGIHFNAMFHSNRSVVLDLSKWNVSNGKNFGQMFENCKHLTEIKGLENWNTSNGQAFYSMFSGCRSLRELDLSSFDTRNANPRWVDDQRGATTSGMDDDVFGSWYVKEDGTVETYRWNMSLEKVTLGPNFSFNGDGTCTTPAVLTAPSSDYVPGADGNWYDTDGKRSAPKDIPNLTAGTYYATLSRVEGLDVLVKNDTLRAMANAVRSVAGTSELYAPSDLVSVVAGLGNLVEVGKQTAYDEFWDGYQRNGARTNYNCAFAGEGWVPSIFKPKYNIVPTNARFMFWAASSMVYTDLVEHLLNCGVEMDFSKCTDFYQAFSSSTFSRLGRIDMTSGTDITSVFSYNNTIQTIDVVVLTEAQDTSKALFTSANALINLSIEGVIAKSINLQWSPLTTASMKSVITHLKDYSGTSSASTYTVKFSDACWTSLDAEGVTSPNGNLWSEYVLDLGWLK